MRLAFLGLCLFLIANPIQAMETILVFGDSISAAYKIPMSEGWVSILQRRLEQDYSGHLRVVNESVSGETTAGGLSRLDPVLQQYQPSIVVLELGVNDGLRGYSPLQLKSQLTELVRRCQKAGASVLLVSMKMPPTIDSQEIARYYAVYAEVASATKVSLIPYILDDIAYRADLLLQDQFHPNAKAQSIIESRIWQGLSLLLKQPQTAIVERIQTMQVIKRDRYG